MSVRGSTFLALRSCSGDMSWGKPKTELERVMRALNMLAFDLRGGFRLVQESCNGLLIRRDRRQEDLDRDALAQELVLGTVDDAHAAATDDALDAKFAGKEVSRLRQTRLVAFRAARRVHAFAYNAPDCIARGLSGGLKAVGESGPLI